MQNTGRKRTIAIVAAAVVVVGGIGVWVYAANHPSPRGSVPAASAPVATVALTYLKAAKAHDCGLTQALTLSSTSSWCEDPRMLSYSGVSKPYPYQPTGGKVEGSCVDFSMRTKGGNIPKSPTGTAIWSFCFAHTSQGWRLQTQGQG
jgi:hypothetical protein